MITHALYLGSGQWGLFLPGVTLPALVSSDLERIEAAAALLKTRHED